MQLQAKEAARTGAGYELFGEERLGAEIKEWLTHRRGIELGEAKTLLEKFMPLLAQGAEILAAHEGGGGGPGSAIPPRPGGRGGTGPARGRP